MLSQSSPDQSPGQPSGEMTIARLRSVPKDLAFNPGRGADMFLIDNTLAAAAIHRTLVPQRPQAYDRPALPAAKRHEAEARFSGDFAAPGQLFAGRDSLASNHPLLDR